LFEETAWDTSQGPPSRQWAEGAKFAALTRGGLDDCVNTAYVWRAQILNRTILFRLIVAGLIVVPLYPPVLRDVPRAWWTNPYAGHGPLVPAFSAFVLWNDRGRTRVAFGTGHSIGLAVILLALGLLFAGRSMESLLLQGVSLVQLPGITLAVATVCNGLRFLSALVMLTIAFALLTQRSLSRKLILVTSAIPIAILANAVRVATIALAVYYIGPGAAKGFIHDSTAKGVWAMTLVPLVILALILRRGAGSPRLEASCSVRIRG